MEASAAANTSFRPATFGWSAAVRDARHLCASSTGLAAVDSLPRHVCRLTSSAKDSICFRKPALRRHNAAVSESEKDSSIESYPTVSRRQDTVSKRKVGRLKAVQANAEEPIYEDGDDLYEAPDEFGGWKGIRKSALTAEWEENGRHITVNGYDWFVVEEKPSAPSAKSTVLLLPGLPAHSYSYREVLRLLSEAGHRAISFDWPGFGLSDKPSPKAFGFRTADYLEGLEGLIEALELEDVTLVAQGFLGGPVGIKFAAANPDRVSKLVVMNAPLQTNRRLPKPFQQLTLPFIGAAFAQDPTRLADLSFNSSGPYEMAEDDLQVYRQPYMESSDAGFAALAAVKNLDVKSEAERCTALLTSESFRTPTLFTLCDQDKWLSPPSDLLKSLSGKPWISSTTLEGAGHFAQEDWPEKVVAAIRRF